MKTYDPAREQAREAVRRAVAYLRTCKIQVPKFTLTTRWSGPVGGSMVIFDGTHSRLNIGKYPTPFLRNWISMHELGHVLWNHHQPHRRMKFREAFGTPSPPDYDKMHLRHSWKTAATHRLSWFPGPHRPAGEPSWYGATAGGEERFCELIALMYANGDFAMQPPPDLAGLWQTCWEQGLAHMA